MEQDEGRRKKKKKKEVADETEKEGKGSKTRGKKKFRAGPTRGAARNARVEFKRNVCTRKNEADRRIRFFMVAYTVSPEGKKKKQGTFISRLHAQYGKINKLISEIHHVCEMKRS